jgi:hypothetical protein
VKTKERTPQRTASDAAWIASGTVGRNRFNPFLDLISEPSYYDPGEMGGWSGIRNSDLSDSFDLKISNCNNYPVEGMVIACLPGASFVLETHPDLRADEEGRALHGRGFQRRDRGGLRGAPPGAVERDADVRPCP